MTVYISTGWTYSLEGSPAGSIRHAAVIARGLAASVHNAVAPNRSLVIKTDQASK